MDRWHRFRWNGMKWNEMEHQMHREKLSSMLDARLYVWMSIKVILTILRNTINDAYSLFTIHGTYSIAFFHRFRIHLIWWFGWLLFFNSLPFCLLSYWITILLWRFWSFEYCTVTLNMCSRWHFHYFHFCSTLFCFILLSMFYTPVPVIALKHIYNINVAYDNSCRHGILYKTDCMMYAKAGCLMLDACTHIARECEDDIGPCGIFFPVSMWSFVSA